MKRSTIKLIIKPEESRATPLRFQSTSAANRDSELGSNRRFDRGASLNEAKEFKCKDKHLDCNYTSHDTCLQARRQDFVKRGRTYKDCVQNFSQGRAHLRSSTKNSSKKLLYVNTCFQCFSHICRQKIEILVPFNFIITIIDRLRCR